MSCPRPRSLSSYPTRQSGIKGANQLTLLWADDGGQCNHSPYQWKDMGRCHSAGCGHRKGQELGMWASLGAGGGREGGQAWPHPDLSPWKPEHQNCEITSLCCLQPPVCGSWPRRPQNPHVCSQDSDEGMECRKTSPWGMTGCPPACRRTNAQQQAWVPLTASCKPLANTAGVRPDTYKWGGSTAVGRAR